MFQGGSVLIKVHKMHNFMNSLIKTTVHQMQDFQLEKHQKRLAAGFRPNPLGELTRFQTLKRRKNWREEERERERRKGTKGNEGK